jgi:hypothetical protein
MSADRAVTANFTRDSIFEIFRSGAPSGSPADTLANLPALAAHDEVRMLATEVTADFTLNKALTLSGGWLAGHTIQSPIHERTTLTGTLTVQDAASEVRNTNIKGKITIKSGKLNVNGVSIRS